MEETRVSQLAPWQLLLLGAAAGLVAGALLLEVLLWKRFGSAEPKKEKILMKKMLLLLLLLPALGLSAPQGATIQSWYHDPGDDLIHIRVVNTSEQPITAYVLALPNSTLVRDFINDTTLIERYRGTGDEDQIRRHVSGPIPPGGYYDELVAPQATFHASVEAVVFADRTTTGDRADVQLVVAQRRATVAAIDAAVKIISSSSTPAAAADLIQKMLDAWKAGTQEHRVSPAELEIIVRDLRQLHEPLEDYAAAKLRQRDIWAAEARLEVNQ
jgi:hypothetical protein